MGAAKSWSVGKDGHENAGSKQTYCAMITPLILVPFAFAFSSAP